MAATLAAGGNLSDFEPGKKKLLELKKLGVRVLPTNEAMAQALQSGEVWITPMWRARAIQWQNAGIPVTNVAPAEGAIPIVFDFGVPKNAPNKDGGLRLAQRVARAAGAGRVRPEDGLCADGVQRAAAAGARTETHLQRGGAGQAEVARLRLRRQGKPESSRNGGTASSWRDERLFPATRNRHGRACPGHPRLVCLPKGKKDVDARHKVSCPGRPKGRTRVPGMTNEYAQVR